MLLCCAMLCLSPAAEAAPPTGQVFNVYNFGAVGDGVANDTAALQSAIDASVAAGGVAWSPPNGTHLLGGGLKFIGHAYDGVRVQLDAPLTLIDDSRWPHCHRNCTTSSRMPVCESPPIRAARGQPTSSQVAHSSDIESRLLTGCIVPLQVQTAAAR